MPMEIRTLDEYEKVVAVCWFIYDESSELRLVHSLPCHEEIHQYNTSTGAIEALLTMS